MKKLLAIILTALLLLSACGGQKEENADGKEYAVGYETARPSTIYSNLNLNGMFYPESFDAPGFSAQRLWFFDFDSMQAAIMCVRPNCKHDDPEVCTSFRINYYPTAVGDKLYFFERGSEWDDYDKAYKHTNVWRAELYGGSRLKIDTIDGLELLVLVVKGSVVYFTAKKEIIEFDRESGWMLPVDPAEYHVCSYDLENKVFTDYGVIAEGYNGGAGILGEYNGGLYIRGSYADDRNDDYHDYNDYYIRLDIKKGEISDWDMPISSLDEYGSTKPMFASGGFYGYMDGNNTIIVDSAGNEMVLENYELRGSTPINGYLFNEDNGTAIDLSNGEIVEINMDVIPKYNYVLCWHNGSYIIYNEFADGNFKKVSPDELFKE